MRARSVVRGGVSFTLVSSLCWLLAGTAGAAEEEEAAPSAEPSEAPEAPPPKKTVKPHAAEAEPAPEAPPAPSAKTPPVELGTFAGWKISLSGRLNTFFSLGSGNQLVVTTPDGKTLVEGGGVSLNDNQSDANNNFRTPRIRNGFVANVLGLDIARNLTDTTTMLAHFSLWSDIETNLSVYIQPQTYMQESYLRLEGPWGRFTAGRQLALFSRGEVEIDFLYAHGNGLGWPCNFNGIYATCGQIGFGVMFPFFRPGFLYETPSLGGLTFALGAYDPVILAGKWERVIMPTLEIELAYTTKFSGGMFKLFANGLWQKLGAKMQFENLVNKTVDQYGGAAGFRLEVGPLRVGAGAHYGKGLGFYYAQENSQAAAYNAVDIINDPVDRARDGDLRTFRGFYGQLALVFGPVMLAGGAGASQLIPLDWEKGANGPALPKQNFGINAVFNYHIADNLIFDIDYFRAQWSWYTTTYTQTVNTVNTGITMLF